MHATFTWSGLRDLRRLFASLRVLQRDTLDDGRVVGHVSAADVARVEQIEHTRLRKDSVS